MNYFVGNFQEYIKEQMKNIEYKVDLNTDELYKLKEFSGKLEDKILILEVSLFDLFL